VCGQTAPPNSILPYKQLVSNISTNGTGIAKGLLPGRDFLSGLSESLSQEKVMIFDALTISGMILIVLLIAAFLVGQRIDKPEK
jgi:hypothetical protein